MAKGSLLNKDVRIIHTPKKMLTRITREFLVFRQEEISKNMTERQENASIASTTIFGALTGSVVHQAATKIVVKKAPALRNFEINLSAVNELIG